MAGAEKMNADNRAAYLDSTTDFTYDPADRLTKSVKTGNGAGTQTCVHDDNANVVSQTGKGTSTAFHYGRNRLLTATTSGVTRVVVQEFDSPAWTLYEMTFSEWLLAYLRGRDVTLCSRPDTQFSLLPTERST